MTIPPRGRTVLLFILLALMVGGALQVVGAPLATPAAPSGIVSFEFAGDQATASAILASWGREAQLHAALSLGLDYLFLLAYAAAIWGACLWLAARIAPQRPLLASVGRWLGWAQWLAAALDAVENYALIRILLGADGALWPTLAWWCAAIKFSLVAAGLLFALFGALYLVWQRR